MGVTGEDICLPGRDDGTVKTTTRYIAPVLAAVAIGGAVSLTPVGTSQNTVSTNPSPSPSTPTPYGTGPDPFVVSGGADPYVLIPQGDGMAY